MAEQQLAAPREERAEAACGDIQDRGAERPRPRRVGAVVEAAEVPARLACEHQKPHVAGRHREGLRSRDQGGQLQFASGRETRQQLRAGPWVADAAIDGAHGLHLFGGEAVGAVARLALQDGRIEPAAARLRHQAVDQSVQAVALGDIGLVQRRQFRRGQPRPRLADRLESGPQALDHQVGHGVGRRHGRDGVVVFRVAIGLHQPLAAAGGA